MMSKMRKLLVMSMRGAAHLSLICLKAIALTCLGIAWCAGYTLTACRWVSFKALALHTKLKGELDVTKPTTTAK